MSLTSFPKKVHQGWHGIVHGGLVGTVMDEVMARAVTFAGNTGYRRDTVRFLKPARVDSRIRFAGRYRV